MADDADFARCPKCGVPMVNLNIMADRSCLHCFYLRSTKDMFKEPATDWFKDAWFPKVDADGRG
jgi:hypothetical protein